MKPNKLHIILKIFGFLVFSIGILYICQFFTETLEEGFAIPRDCKEVQDSGRKLLLCASSNAANIVFDNTSNLPGKYDNVCVGSGEFGTDYYTCYTRPGPPVYNDTYGIYRPFDPKVDNDTLPTDLLPSIDTFCSSYDTNTLKVNRGIASTLAVLNVIRDTGSNTIIYQNQVRTLKQLYCGTPNGKMVNTCSNINVAYNSLTAPAATANLTAASNAVQNSLNSLSNMSTQMYSIYNGSRCQNLASYAI